MDTVNIASALTTFLLGVSTGALTVFYLLKGKIDRYRQANSLRRISMLEQVAQHVGKVSHTFSKYSSLVTEIGPKTDRMTPKQNTELDELSNELVAVYEEISIAESKLLLMGEKRLEKAMKLYTAKMAQFRKQIFPGRYSNPEDIGKLKKDISSMREQFYDILSERYDHNNFK